MLARFALATRSTKREAVRSNHVLVHALIASIVVLSCFGLQPSESYLDEANCANFVEIGVL